MGIIFPSGRDKRNLGCSREGRLVIRNLAFHHHIAFFKALFHISLADIIKWRIISLKIAAGRQTVVLVVVPLGFDVILCPVHFRRTRLDGLLHIIYRSQLLILHLDQLQRFLRNVIAHGAHRCHHITCKTQMLIHHRTVGGNARLPCRRVLVGHDGFHPGHGLCL